MDDIISKVAAAIEKTGYPLEQKASHLLQERGWTPFHSRIYVEPHSGKERELDILAYKLINDRRVELRISCKRSLSKPWVLFTEDGTRYGNTGKNITVLPLPTKKGQRFRIEEALSSLNLFSHQRSVINYTAFAGKNLGDDARAIVRDGLFSAMNSIYYNVFPHGLMSDPRDKVVFLVTLFDGELFESYFDAETGKNSLEPTAYGQWSTLFRYMTDAKTIIDAEGYSIDLAPVMCWLGNQLTVEIVTLDFFKDYLANIEAVFSGLDADDLAFFGLPWIPENFPKHIKDAKEL